MTEPRWLSKKALLVLVGEAVRTHGGLEGIRDDGLLDSALARPQNLFAYGSDDIHALAGAYAFGLVRNHPFVDGNKRAGFLAAAIFLEINGWRLSASESDAALKVLELAAGELDEDQFSEWLRANSAVLT